jgi:hypothetical protein
MGWETRGSAPPGEQPAESPGEALHVAMARLAELREYAAYFIAAKMDGIKIGLRNAGIYAALGVLGAIAGASFIVVAATLLLIGCAHGLGALFGGRDWLGDLIVGVVVLAAVAIGAVLGLKMITGTSRKKTVEKYETRQHQQRRSYGHDVKQRAHEQQPQR